MDNYQYFQNPPASSSEEDEVTFLLRLKPAPTPPTRRRKNIPPPQSNAITTPKGWDVIIERRDISSPNASSMCSSPVKQRRCSFEEKGGNRGSFQGEQGNRARSGDRSGVNCETGEANVLPENGSSPFVDFQEVSPNKILHMTRHKRTDATNEEEPPPVPPRFKPSAPPQEPEDNYYWWAPRPVNWGGGFSTRRDENRDVGGFSNYYMFPSFESPNQNSAVSLDYDATLYNGPDQSRHSIVQTTTLAQSISTYSIARPLSASGFYIGPGQVHPIPAPYPENGNNVIDHTSGRFCRHSGNDLGNGAHFSPLPAEKSYPVVGRPPKPLSRGSLVESKSSLVEPRNSLVELRNSLLERSLQDGGNIGAGDRCMMDSRVSGIAWHWGFAF